MLDFVVCGSEACNSNTHSVYKAEAVFGWRWSSRWQGKKVMYKRSWKSDDTARLTTTTSNFQDSSTSFYCFSWFQLSLLLLVTQIILIYRLKKELHTVKWDHFQWMYLNFEDLYMQVLPIIWVFFSIYKKNQLKSKRLYFFLVFKLHWHMVECEVPLQIFSSH